jgi:hypothetical protein
MSRHTTIAVLFLAAPSETGGTSSCVRNVYYSAVFIRSFTCVRTCCGRWHILLCNAAAELVGVSAEETCTAQPSKSPAA